MDPEQIPLRDLHLPTEIGWWPLAPGWWVLIAVVALGLGWLLYRAFLNWRRNYARRVALKQLDAIATEYNETRDQTALGIQLSELLRRAMLAYAPRSTVAGLTGDQWLIWLDDGLDEPVFANGPGRALNSLPYRNPENAGGDEDIVGLIDAVKTRLRTPFAEGAA